MTSTEVPRHPRAAGLLLGGLLTGLLVASGGFGLWTLLTTPQTLRSEAQEQTYQQPVSDVDIDVETSSVTLTSGSEGAVRVQRQLSWSRAKPVLEERIIGRTLQIRVICPRSLVGRAWHCRVDFAVEVPPGTAVRVRITSGAVRAEKLAGALQLTAGFADITLSGTRGPLWARTDSGDIIGTNLGGLEVDAQTRYGEIDVRFAVAPDDVQARTDNGDVTVVVPVAGAGVDGYQIRAAAGHGREDVGVPHASDGRHTIAAFAGQGDVLIRHGSAP